LRARRYCPSCLAAKVHSASDSGELRCERCGTTYSARFEGITPVGSIERCAFCGNRAFFLQKDFDQRLGCLLLTFSLGAALLVGWTFGWIWFTPVLLVAVLVDWVVARRIQTVTICYRCDAEYRDLPINPRHRGYDPHVAERYAETKTLRRMR
jgi:hypothetical protein